MQILGTKNSHFKNPAENSAGISGNMIMTLQLQIIRTRGFMEFQALFVEVSLKILKKCEKVLCFNFRSWYFKAAVALPIALFTGKFSFLVASFFTSGFFSATSFFLHSIRHLKGKMKNFEHFIKNLTHGNF